MGLQAEHELHRRRSGRNIGLGIVLALFVALVFTLSVVKVQQGGLLQGFGLDADPWELLSGRAWLPGMSPSDDAADSRRVTIRL